MSRIRVLTTGETIMTQGNALRHYIAKSDKLLKRIETADKEDTGQLEDLYSQVQRLLSEASKVLDCGGCEFCMDDDLGYCGLRRERSIKEPEKTLFHCFPATVKSWKWSLKEKAYGL